jgi:hypothetical protein
LYGSLLLESIILKKVIAHWKLFYHWCFFLISFIPSII